MTNTRRNSTPQKSKVLALTTLTAIGLFGIPSAGMADVGSHEVPIGGNVTHGSATVTNPALGQLDVNQHTNRVVIDWNTFNVGTEAKVEFFQPGSSSWAINYARGGDGAKILGQLKANGNVGVFHSAGVYFGANATVDVNGLIASTGRIDNDAFMAGADKFQITEFGSGSVVNDGLINVAEAGLAAFVAPHVVNRGLINARLGRVAMAAGDVVTVDLYGDQLVEIALDDKHEDALIEQLGEINAEGGVVTLTAQAAKDVVDTVINMDGVIKVTSVTQQGGKIILSGGEQGKVSVSGTLDASGQGGGDVAVTGQSVELTGAGEIFADGGENGDGGNIFIIGRDEAILSGRAYARGGKNGGNGGFVELSTDGMFGLTGIVDTTATNGETGTFLLDPRDLEIRVGTGFTILDNNIHESTIEWLSNFTDIYLLARRNITVSDAVYGASDGVITLANNRNLTIATTNTPYTHYFFGFPIFTETNNAGSINLTGNNTYGSDLEFKTSGSGSINVFGATANDQRSDIILSKLTTEAGDINVRTKKGNITWKGDVASTSGDISAEATKGITVAKNVSISLLDGDVDFETSNNNIQFKKGSSVSATGVDLEADKGTVQFDKNSVVTSTTLDIQAKIAKQHAQGVFNVGTLSGSVKRFADILGTANNIDAVGGFAVGTAPGYNDAKGLVIVDADGFDITGAVTSTGGDIDITTLGGAFNEQLKITSTGSVSSQGGDITIDSNGGFTVVQGSIDAGAGDLDINSRQTHMTGSSTVDADEANFTGGRVWQTAGSTLTANILTGSIDSTATFGGTNNQVGSIGDFATGTAGWSTGGFTFVEADGFDVDGTVSTTGGDINISTGASAWNEAITIGSTGALTSAGGNINVDNNGSSGGFITVFGDIDAGAGDIDLNARQLKLQNGSTVTGDQLNTTGSIVDQASGSTITANLLTGSLAAWADFSGTNNQIGSIGDFATGTAGWSTGGFTFVEADGFDVDGTVSTTGGDINISTGASAWNEAITIGSTGALTSAGGNINVDNNGSSGGFITVFGDIDAGAGDIDLNARQLKLQNGSTVTGDQLNTTGSIVDQASGSTITANLLTGSLAAWADFSGTNNQIGAVGDFATGTAGWSTGGFTLVDNSGLTIDGTVSTTGGDVDISTDGALWSESLHVANGATVASQGGDIALSNTGGQITVHGTIDARGSLGDVTLTTNNSIQFWNGSEVFAGLLTTNAGQVRQWAGSKIDAEGLTGSATQYAEFLGTANEIDTLYDFATGTAAWYNDAKGFTLVDTGGLDIEGTVSTTGGDIDISTTSSVWSEKLYVANGATVASQGGDIDLTNNGGGQLVVHGTVDATGSAGDVTLTTGGAVQLWNGSQILAGLLTTNASSVKQWAGSTIDAEGLTGSVSTYAEFLGTANEIDTLYDFAAGTAAWYDDSKGFTLVNVTDLTVDGAVSTTGGDIDVTNTGNLDIAENGSFDADGGNINLFQTGTFSTVNGETVRTSGTGTITLQQNDGGSLQDSVDALYNTGTGLNTINVGAGDYTSVTVDHVNVLLSGANAGTAGYAGRGAESTVTGSSPAISIVADNVTVDGFEITSANPGINVNGADDATIVNNYIHDLTANGNATDGVLIRNSKDAYVGQNLIENIGDEGIYANGQLDGLVITENVITNTGTKVNNSGAGIEINSARGSVEISDNTITDADFHGVNVHRSHSSADVEVTGNTITGSSDDGVYGDRGLSLVHDNTILSSGDAGVDVIGSDDVVISENTIQGTGAEGIKVSNSDDAQIRDNEINVGVATTSTHGISVTGGNSVDVDDNTVNNTTVAGIYVESSTFIDLDDNTVTNGADGIYLTGATRADVRGNAVSDMSDDGIQVVNSKDVEIEQGNVITDVTDSGITVHGGSTGVEIDDNEVDGARNGIRVSSGSHNATITNNEVHDTTKQGILVSGLNDVTIEDNHIGRAGDNGIFVENSENFSIVDNYLHSISDDGIDVENSSDFDVTDNTLRNISDDGVDIEDSSDFSVADNDIQRVSGDGIEIIDGEDFDVEDNKLRHIGDDGVDIEDSSDFSVADNDIHDLDSNGIDITNSDAFTVDDNHIGRADENGILIENSEDFDVVDNYVHNTDYNGIAVAGSSDFGIEDNRVERADDDGIDIEDSSDFTVVDNFISRSDDDGIDIEDSSDFDVTDNTVFITDGDGIEITDSEDFDVDGNGLAFIGDDGIDIEDSSNFGIVDNEMHFVKRNGIEVSDSDEFFVAYNHAGYVGANGIFVEESDDFSIIENYLHDTNGDGIEISESEDFDVKRNEITDADDEGIYIVGSEDFLIKKNVISDVENDGIDIEDSSDFRVNRNRITDAGSDGIEIEDSEDFAVNRNRIRHADDDGIDIEGSDNFRVNRNNIRFTGDDGIEISDSSDFDVFRNRTIRVDGDGIEVTDSEDFNIESNTVRRAGDEGIDIEGAEGFTVSKNHIRRTDNGGIEITESSDFTASENDVARTTVGFRLVDTADAVISQNIIDLIDAGIDVSASDNVAFENNEINNASLVGFAATGGENGYLSLSGNTFTDNALGAFFQSGEIDLTGESNTFVGGEVAMLFSPFEFADIGGGSEELFLVAEPTFADLSLVDNTIGTTIFDGQTSYYVQLENGALFEPGSPTIINAVNATFRNTPFGTFSPRKQQGFVTLDQFNYLDGKFYDFTEDSTLGLFFYGVVPFLDLEDIFRDIGAFNVNGAGLNVTINGLPSTGFTGAGIAAGLANLSPAAGNGDEDGLSIEDLANLEPEAGGDDNIFASNCWADALASAESGQSVQITFGNDIDSAMAQGSCSF